MINLLKSYYAEAVSTGDELTAALVETVISAVERNPDIALSELPVRISASLSMQSASLLPDETDFLSDAVQFAIKDAELDRVFAAVCVKPVEALGHAWHGGFDSALKLDGAVRFAQLAGQDQVALFDVGNDERVLSIADANTVISAVSGEFQRAFAIKQSLSRALKAATDGAAASIDVVTPFAGGAA